MLNIKNLTHDEKNDTFTVDLGKYGSVEVRNSISYAEQDVFVQAVVKGITADGSYFPMRKEAYMLFVFMLVCVPNGNEMLVQDGDDADLYESYRLLEEELGILTAARQQSASVDAILTRIEENVDLIVTQELEYRNALLGSGMSIQVQDCMTWLKQILMDVSETVSGVRKLSDKKTEELSSLLTRENLAELMSTLRNLEIALTGK